MHKFWRAIGFSQIKNKKQLNELISKTINHADDKNFVSMDDENTLAEYNLLCGTRMGICVRGEYESDEVFSTDYAIPFFRPQYVSSNANITIERHAEKETFAGICDDNHFGVSLIFYLQNVVSYLKRRVDNQPIMGTSLSLAAMSVDGMIVMPLYKDDNYRVRSAMISRYRLSMVQRAKEGDERAIEDLTLGDMDVYSNISKLLTKQDVLSLVETYFMPYGVECDQYSILAEIKEVEKVKNTITGENVWQMAAECNNVRMDICINEKDLYGEPAVGRRFKGTIWLQGMINFPQ